MTFAVVGVEVILENAPKESPTSKKWNTQISAGFDALLGFASTELDRNKEIRRKSSDVEGRGGGGEPIQVLPAGSSPVPSGGPVSTSSQAAHTVAISPPPPTENGTASPGPVRSRSSSRSPVNYDRHFKKKFFGNRMKEQQQKPEGAPEAKVHPKFRPKGKNWEKNMTNGASPYPPATSPISPGPHTNGSNSSSGKISGRSSVDSRTPMQGHRASPHEGSGSSRPNSAASTSSHSGRLSGDSIPRGGLANSPLGLAGGPRFEVDALRMPGMVFGDVRFPPPAPPHHHHNHHHHHHIGAGGDGAPPFSTDIMPRQPSFGGEPQIFNPLARHGKTFPPK